MNLDFKSISNALLHKYSLLHIHICMYIHNTTYIHTYWILCTRRHAAVLLNRKVYINSSQCQDSRKCQFHVEQSFLYIMRNTQMNITTHKRLCIPYIQYIGMYVCNHIVPLHVICIVFRGVSKKLCLMPSYSHNFKV